MHKNTELGAYAAERVFELDPHDSGPHMILSNIYASAGRSSDATVIPLLMWIRDTVDRTHRPTTSSS
ncbi:hypothetical protein ACS0TY_004872 [Phlomoides rotata]